MSAPIEPTLDAVLGQVTEVLSSIVSETLGARPMPDMIPVLAEAAFDTNAGVTATLSKEFPTDRRMACRSGCTHCCRLPVVTDPLTVLNIARVLRARLRPALLEELRGRLARHREALSGGVVGGEPRPLCPLLDDQGRCGVYAERPLICRAFNAFDAGACERNITRDEPGVRIDSDPVPIEVGAAVARGLRGGLVGAGYGEEHLELVPALELALSRADAAEAWLAGEPLFGPATIVVTTPSGPDA